MSCQKSIKHWQRSAYWRSLKLPFVVIVLFALALWTGLIAFMAVLLLLPLPHDPFLNVTSHVKTTVVNNDTVTDWSAAFFLAVETVSTVGFGNIVPGTNLN